jgi:hypothetical protein
LNICKKSVVRVLVLVMHRIHDMFVVPSLGCQLHVH